MGLKKVTTNITYKVPDWHFCNSTGSPKDKCRFCVKDRTGYRCALYNMPLTVTENVFVEKTFDCKRATAGFKSTVSDVEDVPREPSVSPRTVMKIALDEYTKTKNKLLSQGYPEVLADKVAKEYVLGGK